MKIIFWLTLTALGLLSKPRALACPIRKRSFDDFSGSVNSGLETASAASVSSGPESLSNAFASSLWHSPSESHGEEYWVCYKPLMCELGLAEKVAGVYAFKDFKPIIRKIWYGPPSGRSAVTLFCQMLMALIKEDKSAALPLLLTPSTAEWELPNAENGPKTLGIYLLSYSITTGKWTSAIAVANFLHIDWMGERGARILTRVCGCSPSNTDGSYVSLIGYLITVLQVDPCLNLGDWPNWSGSSALYAALAASNHVAVKALMETHKVPARDDQNRDLLEMTCRLGAKHSHSRDILACLKVMFSVTPHLKAPSMLVSRLGSKGYYPLVMYFLSNGTAISEEISPEGDSALSLLAAGLISREKRYSEDGKYLCLIVMKHDAVQAMARGFERIPAERALQAADKFSETFISLYRRGYLPCEVLMHIVDHIRYYVKNNGGFLCSISPFNAALNFAIQRLGLERRTGQRVHRYLTTKLHALIALDWYDDAANLITKCPKLLVVENAEALRPLELIYRKAPSRNGGKFVRKVVEWVSKLPGDLKDLLPVRPGTKMDFTWDETLPYFDTCVLI
jgi:hypothetical protein